jgi:hypothetical protein
MPARSPGRWSTLGLLDRIYATGIVRPFLPAFEIYSRSFCPIQAIAIE